MQVLLCKYRSRRRRRRVGGGGVGEGGRGGEGRRRKRIRRRRRKHRKCKIYSLTTLIPKAFQAPKFSNRKEHNYSRSLLLPKVVYFKPHTCYESYHIVVGRLNVSMTKDKGSLFRRWNPGTFFLLLSLRPGISEIQFSITAVYIL